MGLNIKGNGNNVTADEMMLQLELLVPNTRKTYAQSRPWASQSFCPRQMTLQAYMQEGTVPVSQSLEAYARIGTALESWIIDTYSAANELIIKDYQLDKELFEGYFDIGGKIDLIVQNRGRWVLMDVKTAGVVDGNASIPLSIDETIALNQGNDIIIRAQDERPKIQKPKGTSKAYIAQLQTYAAITGLDNAFLLFVSRKVQDTFNVSSTMPSIQYVPVDTSIDALTKHITKIIYAIKMRDLGQMPSIPTDITKTNCSDAFCPFVKSCWQDEPFDMLVSSVASTLSPDEDKALKMTSFEIAKEYMANRPARLEKFKVLINNEKAKRTLDTLAKQ